METEKINKYKNGKIYKLISHETDKVYVGSTCQELSKRLYDHKKSHKHYNKTGNNYTTAIEMLKLGDAEIILIENYPCNNKNELYARENFHIEKMGSQAVNKHHPTRPREIYDIQYRKSHVAEQRIISKNHYQKNKEKILERHRKYNEDNKHILYASKLCICGRTFTKHHKNRHEKTKFHQNYLNEQQD